MTDQKRRLVVEDDPLAGQIICDALADAAFEVDGPHRRLADGMAAVAAQFPDFAILDVRLGHQDVAMLADDLQRYGIGFAFCSGAGPGDRLTARFPDAMVMAKPFDRRALVRVVTQGSAGY
jgi:DNA-binding response OmpR family regulator